MKRGGDTEQKRLFVYVSTTLLFVMLIMCCSVPWFLRDGRQSVECLVHEFWAQPTGTGRDGYKRKPFWHDVPVCHGAPALRPPGAQSQRYTACQGRRAHTLLPIPDRKSVA